MKQQYPDFIFYESGKMHSVAIGSRNFKLKHWHNTFTLCIYVICLHRPNITMLCLYFIRIKISSFAELRYAGMERLCHIPIVNDKDSLTNHGSSISSVDIL